MATWPITGESYMMTPWLYLSNSPQKGLGWAFYDNPHNAQTGLMIEVAGQLYTLSLMLFVLTIT